MGGEGMRTRRPPRPLGFPGVARRIAFALAAVQFATCAALAVETAGGFDGVGGADGGTAPAPAADPPSMATRGASGSATPTVEDTAPRAGAMDAGGTPDLGSSAPLLEASPATVCATKGAWEAFDNEVLRQTNVSHSEARVCVTDAEEGASAAAAAAAEARAAAKREALAKKKEKEKEKKIPSLRDFKSDLEAKVADARDAKKGKKEVDQREKGQEAAGEAETGELRRERRVVGTESGDADPSDGEIATARNGRRRDESAADAAEPVPTPPAFRVDARENPATTTERDAPARSPLSRDGARGASEAGGDAAPRAGDEGRAARGAAPVPKPTPAADPTTTGSDSIVPTGERWPGGTSDAATRGEPSVEPTPVSRTAAPPDSDATPAGAARVSDAAPESGRAPVGRAPARSVAADGVGDGDGPPTPTGLLGEVSETEAGVSGAEDARATEDRPETGSARVAEATPPREPRARDETGAEREAGERASGFGAASPTRRADATDGTSPGDAFDAVDPAARLSGSDASDASAGEADAPGAASLSLRLSPAARDAYAAEVNYAAASNGAKVVSANPESKSTAKAVLVENKDSYYLSPCATSGDGGKWITVELSETVAVTAVTVANYEFHASAPRAFEVWGTAGPAEQEDGYRLILRAVADPGREPQTFEAAEGARSAGGAWSKHVRFAFTSHYGQFHFCTLSLLRVHGKDATQTLKEEMEAIDAEAREVEAILRENDENSAREKAEAEAEAEARAEAEAAASRSSRAAAAREPETTRDGGVGDAAESSRDGVPSETRADEASSVSEDAGGESGARDADGGVGAREDGPNGRAAAERFPLANGEGAEREGPGPGSASARGDPRRRDGAKANDASGADDPAPLADDAKANEAEAFVDDSVVADLARPDARDDDARDAADPRRTDEDPSATSSSREDTTASDRRDEKEPSSPSSAGASRLEATDAFAAKSAPSSSPDNVFSIMAKKIKALELNQSMFDRYVEASNARVADRLDELSAAADAAEEAAANATAAALSAEQTALAAAKESAASWDDKERTRRAAAERRATELERRLAAAERAQKNASAANRFAMGAFLLVFATTTTLFAAAALLDAAVSRDASEGGRDEVKEKPPRALASSVPAGVGVGGLNRARAARASFANPMAGLTFIRRAFRSARASIAALDASAEEARHARIAAGVGALLVAALCAACGCWMLFGPPASAAAASSARAARRGVVVARTVAARLARVCGDGASALVSRVHLWRLRGGGDR